MTVEKMGKKARIWLEAFRLRTLPLALSSIFLGAMLAAAEGKFRLLTTVLAVLTTLFLQILSNLANDYGDHRHGLDSEGRRGPVRTLQSGALSPKEMRRAIVTFALLSLFSGVGLILSSTAGRLNVAALFFLLLGLGAIAAAIKYTVGKHPYGYQGLGDLFVLLFFGLAGVGGTYYLNAHTLPLRILLPATATGLLATGVLNLNNMRDAEDDSRKGKHTLAVILGKRGSRTYHAFLLFFPLLLGIAYVFPQYRSPGQLLFLITTPFLVANLRRVFRSPSPAHLDPLLRQLALTTLLFSLTLGLGMLIF